jgi:hypothetical protein
MWRGSRRQGGARGVVIPKVQAAETIGMPGTERPGGGSASARLKGQDKA